MHDFRQNDTKTMEQKWEKLHVLLHPQPRRVTRSAAGIKAQSEKSAAPPPSFHISPDKCTRKARARSRVFGGFKRGTMIQLAPWGEWAWCPFSENKPRSGRGDPIKTCTKWQVGCLRRASLLPTSNRRPGGLQFTRRVSVPFKKCGFKRVQNDSRTEQG